MSSDMVTAAGTSEVAAVHTDVDLVLTTTRSVRKRMDLERPVAREAVEACLELALQAPSGANRQDWEFIAVDDPAVKEGVAAVYRAAFEDHYGSRSEPSAAGNRLPKGVGESAHRLAEIMHRVPVLVIPVRHSVPPQERAGQASWWASILPAAWSFMLAARSRGLVTSYTARGCDREEELAKVLGLEYPGVAQAGIIAVGHPDHQAFKVAHRRPLEDLLEAERQAGVTVRSGDALFVRLGREVRWAAEGGSCCERLDEGGVIAGLHPECLTFLRERDVAVLASDAGTDQMPPKFGLTLPVHIGTIVFLGMPLLDGADMEELSRTCEANQRWEFLLTLSPLAIPGATGSLVNPIALF